MDETSTKDRIKGQLKKIIVSPEDFQIFLQSEFIDRCKRRKNYSLRSFARQVKVPPSSLSEMMNGKRPITSKMMARLGLSLGLTPEQLNAMAKNFQKRCPRLSHLQFDPIAVDTFSVIADWYHYAILELLALKQFREDLDWIAKVLGISRTEASIAIDRLIRLKMLRRNGKGALEDGTSGFVTNIENGASSEAAKRYQIQLLEKAIEAIRDVPKDLRDHTSMTMAVQARDLPAVKKRIEDFRRELSQALSQGREPDQVYQLSVAFFPLTKEIK